MISELIPEISKSFDTNDVAHCFLGTDHVQRDIDIFIPRSQIQLAHDSLTSLLYKVGYTYLYTKVNSYSTQIYFTDLRRLDLFNVDLMPEFSFRGIAFVAWSDVKDKIIFRNEKLAVLPESELMLHKAVRDRFVRGGASALEGEVFDKTLEDRVLHWSLRIKDPRLRFISFFGLSVVKRPIRTVYGCIHNIWRQLVNWVRPKGKVVCFLGPDGAGKSTQLEFLSNSFFGKKASVIYLFPGFFKRYRPTGEVKVNSNPHGRSLYSPFYSAVKLCVFTAEYILGYFFIIRPQLVQGKNVIFDRYSQDLMVDRVRYRLDLPERVMVFFLALIPRPDITFILSGDPRVIYERKKEVSLEETARQIEKYESNVGKNTHIIRNDGLPEDAAKEVISVIVSAYQND